MSMLITLGVVTFIYFFGPRIFMAICSLSRKMIVREFRRKMRIRNVEPFGPSLNSKISEALKFVLKLDKRKSLGIPNRAILVVIYIIGLIPTLFFAYSENYAMMALFLLTPYWAYAFAITVYRPIKNDREELYLRLYTLKQSRMGLYNKGKKDVVDYNAEFQILEWEDDYISPSKLTLKIPPTFDSLAIEGFLEQFNVHFGNGSAWVADRSDPKVPGWDFNRGVATLVHTPPLPKMALWSDLYIKHENIAWSFFPIALGTENGVRITNPETGEDEYVLGFDVFGDQAKMAKKGVQVGGEITQSPQVLIAGGTGGGKSLQVDTLVPTLKQH